MRTEHMRRSGSCCRGTSRYLWGVIVVVVAVLLIVSRVLRADTLQTISPLLGIAGGCSGACALGVGR